MDETREEEGQHGRVSREEHMATIAVEEAVGGNLEDARWSFYLIKNCESSLSCRGAVLGAEKGVSHQLRIQWEMI